jgi:ferredoxin
MPSLPEEVVEYRRTRVFDADSVPAGLLRSHRTKAGVWGEIVVTRGRVTYVIESSPPQSFELSPDVAGVVEPTQPHHVKVHGDAAFYVRFLRTA